MTQLRAAEYPRPNHTLVHISDTHFLSPGEPIRDVADAKERLTELLDDLVATNVWPEAMIFTGDLADRGEGGAYKQLREVVEPVAERIGAQVIWVMGNHDNRINLRTALLDAPADDSPYDRVFMLGGLRIIVLDSSVPGHSWGEIEPSQYDWLRDVLAEPAPEGSILALHHPPIPCVQDYPVTVELRDQPPLAALLAGSDVRTIIAGHLHYSSFATFAGIPVSVAAATCYTQDLMTPDRGTRDQDSAQSFNLVHVYHSTILHSVAHRSRGAAKEGWVDGPEAARLLRERGVYIPDAPDRPAVDVLSPTGQAAKS